MPSQKLARHRGIQFLGIAYVILSLVHTPLPQPDFHNIRHHDGPGEVCEHHDHLLRWHPGAGAAEDVAVLHWHWFLPASESAGVPSQGSGPAFHAHVPDWQISTWDDGPRISPDSQSRFVGRLGTNSLTIFSAILPNGEVAALQAVRPRSLLSFGATFAPGIPRASLLQRWTC